MQNRQGPGQGNRPGSSSGQRQSQNPMQPSDPSVSKREEEEEEESGGGGRQQDEEEATSIGQNRGQQGSNQGSQQSNRGSPGNQGRQGRDT